ncbi:hypothetical protein BaRGS_00030735 [Batillaria attramentaria]|uniref:AIG1-type G domain-containing protein n=1 Tax=Batillaria attramentaria TaxID=370345 RepID=A0ABD0JTS5_9CAEN
MIRQYTKRSVICAVVLMYALSSHATRECAYWLIFPTLNHSLILTAQENKDVVLTFQLESSCSLPNNFDIEVIKSDTSRHTIRAVVCSIQHIDGVCYVSMPSNCTCKQNGMYELRRTVQMTDSAVWIWRTKTDKLRETEVYFNITAVLPSEASVFTTTIHKAPTDSTHGPQTQDASSPSTTTVPRVFGPTPSSSTSPKANADTTDDLKASDASSPQIGQHVVIVVGIIAFAAISIAALKFCMNKGSQNHQGQPQVDYQSDAESNRQRTDSTEESEYHMYWEPNELPPHRAVAEAPAARCQAPRTLPDDYLTPVPLPARGGDCVNLELHPVMKHADSAKRKQSVDSSRGTVAADKESSEEYVKYVVIIGILVGLAMIVCGIALFFRRRIRLLRERRRYKNKDTTVKHERAHFLPGDGSGDAGDVITSIGAGTVPQSAVGREYPYYAYARMRETTENLDTIRIVMIGKTGCGKSSLGNSILGVDEFKPGSGFSSETAECQHKTCVRDNHRYKVVDTPGLCDVATQEGLYREIAKTAYHTAPGPHVILLVLRCDRRYTLEEHEAYETLKKLVGEEMCKYMIVVFNAIDEFRHDDPSDIGGMRACLKENLDKYSSTIMKTVLQEVNGRYFGMTNKARKEVIEEQIEDLLGKMKVG